MSYQNIVDAIFNPPKSLHDWEYPIKVSVEGFPKKISLTSAEAMKLAAKLASAAQRANKWRCNHVFLITDLREAGL